MTMLKHGSPQLFGPLLLLLMMTMACKGIVPFLFNLLCVSICPAHHSYNILRQWRKYRPADSTMWGPEASRRLSPLGGY